MIDDVLIAQNSHKIKQPFFETYKFCQRLHWNVKLS